MTGPKCALWWGLFCLLGTWTVAAIPVRVEGTLDPPAAYGLGKFQQALADRGVALERDAASASGPNVIVGVAAPGSQLARWIEAGRLSLPEGREALAVKRLKDGNAEYLAVAGRDGVGLMYALLELEDEIRALPKDADWFASVKEASERPANQLRRARLLLHHKKNEATWYYDKAYWDWYLDTLAHDRWNGLNLVFSHQTPYMAPMFAWHFIVPEYPNIRGKGVTDEEMARNLETLKYIGAECERRGIDFCVGIWQYLPWSEKNLIGRGHHPLVGGVT